jgi:hypothetical protein
MSLLLSSPIISLSPIIDAVYEPVSLLPLPSQILVSDRQILYDPFRTFDLFFPTVPAFYVTTPDLNTDLKLQKKVLNNIWSKLENGWILDYTKIFKYIVGSKGNYKLVSSLSEAENNKFSSENMEDKAKWFLSNIYTRSNLVNTIDKFRKKTGVDLWNVDNDEDMFKAFVYHQIKRFLFEKLA